MTRRAVFVAFSLVLAVACSSGGDGGRSTADAAPATATAPPESSTDPAEDTSTSDPTVDNTFAVPPAGPAYSADLDPGGLGLPQPPGEPFDLLDLVGALIDAGFTVRAQQGSLAPPGCGEWWESTFLRVERDALEMTDFSTWTYPDRATLETHWMVDASGSAVQREGSSCLETIGNISVTRDGRPPPAVSAWANGNVVVILMFPPAAYHPDVAVEVAEVLLALDAAELDAGAPAE